MVSRALFSSEKEDWATPDQVLQALQFEFCFELDAAASASNTVVPHRFFTKEQDALKQDWQLPIGDVWLNPPYGRKMGAWVKKAAETARAGTAVVCLLPSRTDVRWWHEHVWDLRYDRPRDGVEIRFLKGRVRFVGAKAGAPFPSVIVVFRPPRGGR